MSADVKPYIVLSKDGGVLRLLQTNEKGYKKSIENNQIWAVNPETERLLPETLNGRIRAFREKAGWYEVHVEEHESETKEEKLNGGNPEATLDSESDIIYHLYRVIEKRKKELPEGSYTTHLFNSGLSKIRKKTGEEAVELLLAESREEVVYEASDLIYHMLVLLSAMDIGPDEIFKELKNRE